MWLLSGCCESKARLDGKVAIVTGANCGIGKSTALDFVRRGARVIIACRDLKKTEQAADDIRSETINVEGAGHVVVVTLDLASLASVRRCAQYILHSETNIHILVNNAGVCYSPRSVTEDGFEIHMGVNHLGHFLFTCLLLPRIIRSAPARIVTVASVNNQFARGICFDDLDWEKRRYSSFAAYSESKLANVMFSAELARRLEGTGVTTYSLHPGIVVSNGGRHTNTTWFPGAKWLFENVLAYVLKTCEQGAQTTIHCAVSAEAGRETGLYYSDCKKSTCNSKANETELLRKLWNESARLVGLRDWDPFTAEDSGILPLGKTNADQHKSVVFHVIEHPEIPNFYQCVTFGFFETPRQEMVYNVFCVVAMYFLPLLFISFAYTRILCVVASRSSETRGKQQDPGERVSGRLGLRRSDVSNVERARARTLRMTITIVVAFIFCWTPYAVMTLWYMFDRDSAEQVDPRLQDALFIMAVSNSCMNPLVYGSYTTNFRRKCKRCFERIFGESRRCRSPEVSTQVWTDHFTQVCSSVVDQEPPTSAQRHSATGQMVQIDGHSNSQN